MSLDKILTPRLVELGSIKIGTLGDERKTRSGGTFRLPQKLDHFLITTKFRDNQGILVEDEEIMNSLRSDYGDSDGMVRRIPIAVLSDNIEDFLRSNWTYYAGKVCVAKSDGETLWKYYNKGSDGSWTKLDEPETQEWSEKFENMTIGNSKMFKKQTSLDCVISHKNARWGGVYRFRTTSGITGDNLYGSFIHIKELTMGTLVGMPLELVVRPIQVAPEGKPTTVYVVHVEIRGESLFDIQQRSIQITEFQRNHRERIAAIRSEARKIVWEPEQEHDDVQSDIQQEFFPEEKPEEYTDDDQKGNLLRSLMARLSEIGCSGESDCDKVVKWCIGDDETMSSVEQDSNKITAALHKIWQFSKENDLKELLKLATGENE